MPDQNQAQAHQVQIEETTFTRLSDDGQVKKIVADTQRMLNFYGKEISDVRERLENVRAEIIKKDIQN
jgi:hypothetical protein